MSIWDILTLSSYAFMLGMLATGVVAFVQQAQRWVWGSLLFSSLGGWLLLRLQNRLDVRLQNRLDGAVNDLISYGLLLIAFLVIISGAATLVRMFQHGPLQFMAMVTLAAGIISVGAFFIFILFG